MGDVAEDINAKGGALSTAKDLFAGAVGGVAQVLTGMVTSTIVSNVHGRLKIQVFILISFIPHYVPSYHIASIHLSRHDSSSRRDERGLHHIQFRAPTPNTQTFHRDTQ